MGAGRRNEQQDVSLQTRRIATDHSVRQDACDRRHWGSGRSRLHGKTCWEGAPDVQAPSTIGVGVVVSTSALTVPLQRRLALLHGQAVAAGPVPFATLHESLLASTRHFLAARLTRRILALLASKGMFVIQVLRLLFRLQRVDDAGAMLPLPAPHGAASCAGGALRFCALRVGADNAPNGPAAPEVAAGRARKGAAQSVPAHDTRHKLTSRA